MIRYCDKCHNIYFILQIKYSKYLYTSYCPACNNDSTISWPLWRAQSYLEECKKEQSEIQIDNLEKIITIEEQYQLIERMKN